MGSGRGGQSAKIWLATPQLHRMGDIGEQDLGIWDQEVEKCDSRGVSEDAERYRGTPDPV